MDGLAFGRFSGGDRNLFAPLVNDLLNVDRFFVMADFDDYVKVQGEAGQVFCDSKRWSKMSVLNTARSGKFSSDRAIREYCKDIWKISLSR